MQQPLNGSKKGEAVNAPAQILKDTHASPAERLWTLAAEDMASVDALIQIWRSI